MALAIRQNAALRAGRPAVASRRPVMVRAAAVGGIAGEVPDMNKRNIMVSNVS
jgi:hypothetical protein